ncbi:hypothetical protein ASE17_19165 [Phenylobacterium sp. Root77]|nr:hypothetical protein ASC73_20355 [Phenylobacterium sp. Root1277]KQW94221.1 hypothetical protein ASC79_00215 [Phenylobacterium sp. Root1290]KRC38977.1 hypothetical protein ASE17_19165 [Phenylobacterium sp. Root77]
MALSCGFGLCWLGLQPFIVRELISLESTRRLAVLLSPLVLLGLSARPLAASLFVTQKSVDGGFHLAGALLLLATGALFASGR